MLPAMERDGKKWVGKVLRFAVSGALLVAPMACGGSSEEHTLNEPGGPDSPTVNEPPTGGGEDEHANEPMPEPEPPHTNEPAPTEPDATE